MQVSELTRRDFKSHRHSKLSCYSIAFDSLANDQITIFHSDQSEDALLGPTKLDNLVH